MWSGVEFHFSLRATRDWISEGVTDGPTYLLTDRGRFWRHLRHACLKRVKTGTKGRKGLQKTKGRTTRHASVITRHTSDITRHASDITRHYYISIRNHQTPPHMLLTQKDTTRPEMLVHHLWCIISGAYTQVHHLWCITSGASLLVHHHCCNTSVASPVVHILWCISSGVPPLVHHLL